MNVQNPGRRVVEITVNGIERQVDDRITVDALLDLVEAPRSGIAVAVDNAVVPRAEWPTRRVHDGAVVEILTAVQGG